MNLKKVKAIVIGLCLITAITHAEMAPTIQTLKQTASAFNQVAEKGQAAVVSISTTRLIGGIQPFFNDPFFKEFYKGFARQQKREGLGSGVLVSSSGHILTNYHVTRAADEIKILLSDGREFIAQLIGTDKKTDLALLKIEGQHFPFIELQDSDQLKVGDWAIAVGNPFGLSGTVTVGVISATGRAGFVDVDNYADFIQTDAAINPGNSGGALLNIDGELIGINTAIFSQSGGYMGIGFSIPSNTAKRVMEDIIQYGAVKRGMLGVTIQPITDQIMADLNLSSKQGALILEVRKKSAADKAGLKEGDIIIKVNGKLITDHLSLRAKISELRPGESNNIHILRNSEVKQLKLTLLDHKSELQGKHYFDSNLGLELYENTAYLQEKFQLSTKKGLVVTKVQENSLAYKYRITAGQIISKVNSKPIKRLNDYKTLSKNSSPLLLSINNRGYEYNLVINY